MERPVKRLAGLVLGLVVGTTGCGTSGAVYTHVTRPLDVNFDRTPVHQERDRDSINQFNFYVRVVWGSAGQEASELVALEDLRRATVSAVERDVRPRVERLHGEQSVEHDEIRAQVGDEVGRCAYPAGPTGNVSKSGAHHVNVFDGPKRLHVAQVAVPR